MEYPLSDCADLMVRSSYMADSHDVAGFVSLFTPDGVVVVRGEQIVGVNDILAMMQARPRERITRHVMAAPLIVRDGEGARGVAYFVLWEGRAEGAQEPPYPLRSPTVLGEYQQRYRLGPDGWRICEHRSQRIFVNTEAR